MLFDVGLGAAASALAAVAWHAELARRGKRPRPLRIVSFESDLAAPQFAIEQAAALGCPRGHETLLGELLAAGELGELRLVRLQHLSDAQLNAQAPWHWRMDWDISGYNVMTLGMYAEILLRWVGKARTVSATGRLFSESRPDPETGAPRPVRIPESVVATGELENGAHFAYTWSAVAAHSPGDRIEIYGSKGALIYDVPTHEIRLGKVEPGEIKRVGKVGPKELPPVVEIPAALRGDWRVETDFVSAIRQGTPVFPSFADGVDYMEFVEAVGRAMAQRPSLTLPPK